MTWTATLVGKRLVDGNRPGESGLVLIVELSNGTVTVTRQFSVSGAVTRATFRQMVIAEANRLTAQLDLNQLSVGQSVDLTVTPPTPDPAYDAFATLFEQLGRAQRKVDLGIVSSQDADYQALLAAAQAAYLPRFLTV